MPALAAVPTSQPAQDPAGWGRLKRDLKTGFASFADALIDPAAQPVPAMELLGMACVAQRGARDPIAVLRAVRSETALGHYELCGDLSASRKGDLAEAFDAAVLASASA